MVTSGWLLRARERSLRVWSTLVSRSTGSRMRRCWRTCPCCRASTSRPTLSAISARWSGWTCPAVRWRTPIRSGGWRICAGYWVGAAEAGVPLRIRRRLPGGMDRTALPMFGPATFIARVKGDGTAPLARDGDFVNIDPDEPAVPGRFVALRFDDDRPVTVARVVEEDGRRSARMPSAVPGRSWCSARTTRRRSAGVVVFAGRRL